MLGCIRCFILIFVALVLSGCEQAPEHFDPLSPEYAARLERNPGDGRIPDSQAREYSAELRDAGLAAYNAGEFALANEAYLAALYLHANATLYYQFGESLIKTDRFAAAAQAFQRAKQLGYEQPELALYKVAAAYSRLENAPKALEYLSRAFDRGFYARALVLVDPDLAYLREQPDWDAQFRALVSPDVEYDVESIKGLIVEYMPRSPDLLYLCTNGVSLEHVGCSGGFVRGVWRIEAGHLVIDDELICTGVGEGRFATGADCRRYATFKFRGCESVQKPPRIQYLKEKMRQAFQIKARGETPDHFELDFRKYAADPVQCDPHYIPQTIEDIHVEAFADETTKAQ
ncbi:MAG: hypothetical protein NXI24_24480 [bacterium]|nr:hypothetical protein [bacterium]